MIFNIARVNTPEECFLPFEAGGLGGGDYTNESDPSSNCHSCIDIITKYAL